MDTKGTVKNQPLNLRARPRMRPRAQKLAEACRRGPIFTTSSPCSSGVRPVILMARSASPRACSTGSRMRRSSHSPPKVRASCLPSSISRASLALPTSAGAAGSRRQLPWVAHRQSPSPKDHRVRSSTLQCRRPIRSFRCTGPTTPWMGCCPRREPPLPARSERSGISSPRSLPSTLRLCGLSRSAYGRNADVGRTRSVGLTRPCAHEATGRAMS